MWMLVFDKEIMQMRIKEVKEALVYACGAKKVENKDIFQIIQKLEQLQKFTELDFKYILGEKDSILEPTWYRY